MSRAAFLLGLILASVSLTSPALAAPEGGQVRSGSATINGTTIRQHTEKAIIDWLRFNVGAGERVRFLQPSRNAVALNRVVGGDPSLILGQLQANGQIFLVNPNGILFGPGSQVDVGGLVATTLSITDEDFLTGNYQFVQDPAFGLNSVINQGTIASDGTVVLTAPLVSNEGTIAANVVRLGAGSAMRVSFDGLVSYEVEPGAGDSVSLVSVSDVLAGAVQRGGLMTAGELTGNQLQGGNGVLVQAGTITGADVRLDSSAVTAVQAGSRIDAHTITVWSDKNTSMQGTLAADGFVETSGQESILLGGSITAGSFLVDPSDITIVSGTAGANQISTQTINPMLSAGTPVTIDTTGGSGGTGQITQQAGATISKTGGAATTLTLLAAPGGSIVLNDDITSTSGALNVNLNAGSTSGSVTLSATTDILTNNGTFIATGGSQFQALDGSTVQAGSGNVTVNFGSHLLLAGTTTTGNVTLTSTNGRILQSGNAGITGNVLTITSFLEDFLNANNNVGRLTTGAGNDGSFYYHDVNGFVADPIATAADDVSLLSDSGTIQLAGGLSGSTVYVNAGTGAITTTFAGTDISASGNINLSATTGIGTSVNPLKLVQTGFVSLSLTSLGAGSPIQVQHDSDLSYVTVQTNNGSVSLTDRPGGGIGREVVDFTGGVLSGASNGFTDLTFANQGNITVANVDYKNATVTLTANGGSIFDDSVDTTRLFGDSVFMQANAIGTVANMLDLEAKTVNATASIGEIGLWDYSGDLTATVNGPGNAKVRAGAGNLSMGRSTGLQVSLGAAGTLSDVQDNLNGVVATSIYLDAGDDITLESNCTNLTATSTGGDIVIENRGTTNATVNLSAPLGSIDFAQLSPVLTTTSVTSATAGGTLTLSSQLGDVLVDQAVATTGITITAAGAIEELTPDAAADLTASTLQLTASNGIGVASAIETDTGQITATVTASGNLRLAEKNAGVAVTLARTPSGNVFLTSAGGDLTIAGTASSLAGNVTLSTTGSGHVRVNNAAAGTGGTLTVDSVGKILESGTDPNQDVTGANINLTAVAGIGDDGNTLETCANNLSAHVTGTGAIKLNEKVSSVVVTSASTADGLIDLASENGYLQVTSATTNGSGLIHLSTGTIGEVRVGQVTALGHTVQINSVSNIREDVPDAGADVIASDVVMVAGTGIGYGQTLELQTGTFSGRVTGTGTLLVSEVVNGMRVLDATTADGNIFIGSPQGLLRVDQATAAGNLTLTTGSAGDIKLGAVSATGKAVIAASGSVYETAFDAGVDVTAGGDSIIKALNGTLGKDVNDALEVAITGGTLSVLAGAQVGGVSARINGTVSPTNSLIVLTPNPPGTVLFNGVQVYP